MCMTGGHAGLCATAIHKLNILWLSRKRSSSAFPTAQEWLHMLEFGSLFKANDHKLFMH